MFCVNICPHSSELLSGSNRDRTHRITLWSSLTSPSPIATFASDPLFPSLLASLQSRVHDDRFGHSAAECERCRSRRGGGPAPQTPTLSLSLSGVTTQINWPELISGSRLVSSRSSGGWGGGEKEISDAGLSLVSQSVSPDVDKLGQIGRGVARERERGGRRE